MSLRQIIFWSHLVVGVGVGLFVFIMSFTGVLLTYEHKIIHWFEDAQTVNVPSSQERLSVDELVAIGSSRASKAKMMLVGLNRRENAPATIYLLGEGRIDIDPYTGQTINSNAATVEGIFHAIVDIHRSLATGRDGTGRTIMAASNLILLFLIASGLYLWFPRVWKWAFFKLNLVFAGRYPTSKARDYNWHHVIGFWTLVPLFFVVVTGVIISYPWANSLFYGAFGEKAPAFEGPPFLSGGQLGGANVELPEGQQLIPLQTAVEAAKSHNEEWKSIRLVLATRGEEPSVRLLVNTGGGILPEQRTTLVFDRVKGEVVGTQNYEDMSDAQRARLFVRFLHTGEQFGLLGSTIAGLASIAACFLVYTGFALSYRRLILPLLNNRN